jgi:hypothetical protein
MSAEVVIEDQVSPNDEFCSRCMDLGLPGVIPAGQEYKRIAHGAMSRNCCADCWNRLWEECES